MKIISVDYGDSHTGLAVCDRTETIASPVGVIHEKQFERCAEQVAAAVKEYEAGEVVVGNPINMNGSRGPRSQKCELFAEKLRELVNVPVSMWDERSTTVSANNIMNELNRRGKKRRETVDAVAAAVILEGYLGYRRNKGEKST
ncbi:MAG: Holliday junction resolvase RuvX [Eubacterium sp.]|jgi:putative Holliday junction resolvase|nr:Holliday junction resolvase RuvX [Eubacterium sp.]